MHTILNPAPPWEPDRSESVTLWHGCTVLDKNRMEKKRIDLKYSAPDTDFGRGFYTTTLQRQARQWAWHRFYQWSKENPKKTGNQAVILKFQMRRYSKQTCESVLDRGLDDLTGLHFVRGNFENEDYWSLVQHCRQSIAGNRKMKIKKVVNDHKRRPTGWYDFVMGPVSAFWDQRVAMDDSDQISFHTEKALELFNGLVQAGSPIYEWFPVSEVT